MFFSKTLGLVAAASAVSAITPPSYNGLKVLWHDAFEGYAGTLPETDRWSIITGDLNINGEFETYTSSSANLQISGGGSVQLVPWKDSNGAWTSGRIETQDAVTPVSGKITRVEGSLRMGTNPASEKQGIWPAFWMLGEAVRHGTPWPLCGELDILEQRNGDLTAFGTVHCGGSASGGLCSEPNGRGATVAMPSDTDSGFHAWSVTWNLTDASNWQNQQITWAIDGNTYFTLTGAEIGDQATWGTLAHSPFYIVLNVAVGGAFP